MEEQARHGDQSQHARPSAAAEVRTDPEPGEREQGRERVVAALAREHDEREREAEQHGAGHCTEPVAEQVPSCRPGEQDGGESAQREGQSRGCGSGFENRERCCQNIEG